MGDGESYLHADDGSSCTHGSVRSVQIGNEALHVSGYDPEQGKVIDPTLEKAPESTYRGESYSLFDAAYLPLVAEEAAEVIQAITKAMRFGPDHRYRKGSHAGRTNVEAIAYEVGDLLAVIDELGLPADLIIAGRTRKIERLRTYGPHVWEEGMWAKEDMVDNEGSDPVGKTSVQTEEA